MNFLDFARESDEIEGIWNVSHENHKLALEKFVSLPKITVEDLKEFVKRIEPEATYRHESGVNVLIGGRHGMHPAQVHLVLSELLHLVNGDYGHPNLLHRRYEEIHPFSDGNGRSGRALWLWQMVKFRNYLGKYLFLQMYYYETFNEAC